MDPKLQKQLRELKWLDRHPEDAAPEFNAETAVAQAGAVIWMDDQKYAYLALPQPYLVGEKQHVRPSRLRDWLELNAPEAMLPDMKLPEGDSLLTGMPPELDVVQVTPGYAKNIVEKSKSWGGRLREIDYPIDTAGFYETVADALGIRLMSASERDASEATTKAPPSGLHAQQEKDVQAIASVIEARDGVIVRRHGNGAVYFSDEQRAKLAAGELSGLSAELREVAAEQLAGKVTLYQLSIPDDISHALGGANAQLNGTIVIDAQKGESMRHAATLHFLRTGELQPNTEASGTEPKRTVDDRFGSMDECIEAIRQHGVVATLQKPGEDPQKRVCFIDGKLPYKVYRTLREEEWKNGGEYLLGRTFTHRIIPVGVHTVKPDISDLHLRGMGEVPPKARDAVEDPHEGEISALTLALHPRMLRYMEEKVGDGFKSEAYTAGRKEPDESAWKALLNEAVKNFPVAEIKHEQQEVIRRRHTLGEHPGHAAERIIVNPYKGQFLDDGTGRFD